MHVIRQFETHRAKTALLARRPLRGRNLKQTLTIKIDRREWCEFVPRRLREGRERLRIDQFAIKLDQSMQRID